MQYILFLLQRFVRRWELSNKYHIRYNTHHGESDFVWRIFENGKEHLVKNFYIKTPMHGESTIENGIQKWNVVCGGEMIIKDDIAFITDPTQ
jgi:hypothetical protein